MAGSRQRRSRAAAEYAAAGITDPALQADYDRCRWLARTHGRTYASATRLLPPDRRPAVYALYGFARTVDDLVDVAGPADRGAALTDLQADLGRARAEYPVTRAVRDAMARHHIDPGLYDQFFASMQMDLSVSGYDTFDDLSRYMRGSAEVIGRQLLPVLGTTGPGEQAESYAATLGVAFQLTNFIRDVGEDLQRGRLYLPGDTWARHGVDRAALLAAQARGGPVPAPIRAAVRDEIARARTLYRQAEPGIGQLAPASRDCVRTAFILYRDILGAVERGGYRVLDRRARVPRRRQLMVAVPALARAVIARRRAGAAAGGRAGSPSTPTS
jgi:phytoene synthase